MKTRFCKSLLAACLCALFASTFLIALAQDESGQGQGPTFQGQGRAFGGRFGGGGFGGGRFITNSLRFDLEIADGQLSLAPLKGRVDVNEFTLGPGAQPANIESVPATIANLAKYIRAADTNGNINVSPSAAEIQIKDLKLRGADVSEVLDAVYDATDEAVRGTGSFDRDGRYDCVFHVAQFQFGSRQTPTRTVEVFDIRGYISFVGLGATNKEEEIHEKLDQLQGLIIGTLMELHQGDSKPPDQPSFNFHKGTGLFIVVGSPEAIDVTRKFVNALPGQAMKNQQGVP